MQQRSRRFRYLMQLMAMLLALMVDAVHFLRLCLRSPVSLAAENLFLRKQLAMYQERKVKPQRVTEATSLRTMRELCTEHRREHSESEYIDSRALTCPG